MAKGLMMFYEIRRETAVPGCGRELARWMDEHVIPLHEANGMIVAGAFTVDGDEDAFIWIRRFGSEEERAEIVDRVHRDPLFDSTIKPGTGRLVAAEAVTVRLAPTARSRLA